MVLLRQSSGRIRAYLATDRAAAVLERGWPRRRVECAAVPVVPEGPETNPWGGAVHALKRLIVEKNWGRRPIDVALSSEFVRFALIPGVRRQLSKIELQGLTAGLFSKLFGDAAGDWHLRYSACDRTTLIAAAVEKGLVAALEDVARDVACPLRSVTPLWSNLVNAEHRRVSRRSAWIVFAEPRAVVVGLMEGGTWRSLRTRARDPGDQADIGRLLEREFRHLGTGVRDVVLMGEAADLPAEWKVERLALVAKRFGVMPAECRPAAFAGV